MRIQLPIDFWKPGAVSDLPVSARTMKRTPNPAKTTVPLSRPTPIRFACEPKRSVTLGSLTLFLARP